MSNVRATSYNLRANDEQNKIIENALKAKFMILVQIGPTTFDISPYQTAIAAYEANQENNLIKIQEENKQAFKKFRVSLGNPHYCTCQMGQTKHYCIHIIFILLKKFKLPKEHTFLIQTSLIENEIDKLLTGVNFKIAANLKKLPEVDIGAAKKNEKTTCLGKQLYIRKIIGEDYSCPICLDEITPGDNNDYLEKNVPFCSECGNSIHETCFNVYAANFKASNKGIDIKCPYCRKLWKDGRELNKKILNENNVNNKHTTISLRDKDQNTCFLCKTSCKNEFPQIRMAQGKTKICKQCFMNYAKPYVFIIAGRKIILSPNIEKCTFWDICNNSTILEFGKELSFKYGALPIKRAKKLLSEYEKSMKKYDNPNPIPENKIQNRCDTTLQDLLQQLQYREITQADYGLLMDLDQHYQRIELQRHLYGFSNTISRRRFSGDNIQIPYKSKDTDTMYPFPMSRLFLYTLPQITIEYNIEECSYFDKKFNSAITRKQSNLSLFQCCHIHGKSVDSDSVEYKIIKKDKTGTKLATNTVKNVVALSDTDSYNSEYSTDNENHKDEYQKETKNHIDKTRICALCKGTYIPILENLVSLSMNELNKIMFDTNKNDNDDNKDFLQNSNSKEKKSQKEKKMDIVIDVTRLQNVNADISVSYSKMLSLFYNNQNTTEKDFGYSASVNYMMSQDSKLFNCDGYSYEEIEKRKMLGYNELKMEEIRYKITEIIKMIEASSEDYHSENKKKSAKFIQFPCSHVIHSICGHICTYLNDFLINILIKGSKQMKEAIQTEDNAYLYSITKNELFKRVSEIAISASPLLKAMKLEDDDKEEENNQQEKQDNEECFCSQEIYNDFYSMTLKCTDPLSIFGLTQKEYNQLTINNNDNNRKVCNSLQNNNFGKETQLNNVNLINDSENYISSSNIKQIYRSPSTNQQSISYQESKEQNIINDILYKEVCPNYLMHKKCNVHLPAKILLDQCPFCYQNILPQWLRMAKVAKLNQKAIDGSSMQIHKCALIGNNESKFFKTFLNDNNNNSENYNNEKDKKKLKNRAKDVTNNNIGFQQDFVLNGESCSITKSPIVNDIQTRLSHEKGNHNSTKNLFNIYNKEKKNDEIDLDFFVNGSNIEEQKYLMQENTDMNFIFTDINNSNKKNQIYTTPQQDSITTEIINNYNCKNEIYKEKNKTIKEMQDLNQSTNNMFEINTKILLPQYKKENNKLQENSSNTNNPLKLVINNKSFSPFEPNRNYNKNTINNKKQTIIEEPKLNFNCTVLSTALPSLSMNSNKKTSTDSQGLERAIGLSPVPQKITVTSQSPINQKKTQVDSTNIKPNTTHLKRKINNELFNTDLNDIGIDLIVTPKNINIKQREEKSIAKKMLTSQRIENFFEEPTVLPQIKTIKKQNISMNENQQLIFPNVIHSN